VAVVGRCRRWEVKGRGRRRQEVRGSVGRRGVGSGGDGDSAGWVGWRGLNADDVTAWTLDGGLSGGTSC
jgi:hypothetical protein